MITRVKKSEEGSWTCWFRSAPPKTSNEFPYFDKSKKTPLEPGVPEFENPSSPSWNKSENRQYPTTLSHSFPTPISAIQDIGNTDPPGDLSKPGIVEDRGPVFDLIPVFECTWLAFVTTDSNRIRSPSHSSRMSRARVSPLCE